MSQRKGGRDGLNDNDDYELYHKDFDEFVRRGLEAFGLDDHPGARELDRKLHEVGQRRS